MDTKVFTCKAIASIEAIYAAADAQASKARDLLHRLEESRQTEARARAAMLSMAEDDFDRFHIARLERQRLEAIVEGLCAELDLETDVASHLPEWVEKHFLDAQADLHGLFDEAAAAKIAALENLRPGARDGWAAKLTSFITGGHNTSYAQILADGTVEGKYHHVVEGAINALRYNDARKPSRENLAGLKRPLPKFEDFKSANRKTA